MLPATPTTITTNNSQFSITNYTRFLRRTSKITRERCYLLLIQLLFYTIVIIIIYVRFGQINARQIRILSILNPNHNSTLHQESHNRPSHHNHRNPDCSCHSFSYPKRNRTTRCLELYVGLTEVVSNVFCPISSIDNEDEQWLVIQDRQTNHISFNRTWLEYQRGFGNVQDRIDFWIGNENLYWLTNNFPCRLKIELTDWHNETRKAIYEIFYISNQNDDYRLQIDGYSGNMEVFNRFDSFSRWHNNAPFSTYDHYTTNTINCPHLHGGSGWWYHSGGDCAHVHLNGFLPTHTDGLVPFNTGILWVGWKADRHYSYQHVQMAVQPKLRRDRGRHRR
ncbi:unnamed protein product [Adineta ricciae]|uniref:Fibrinogen C-terminal domain-containing protein n=1 Tax=Adineta ricciae TaxID=249248 RepID=A0A815SY38_ADIRI|nr:unnamed protein product [Adineta ricciae]